MINRNIRPQRWNENTPIALNDKIYPSLTLSFKDLPEAKDWQSGETYELEITVKQISKREDENGGSATFEIRKIGVDDDDEADEVE